MTRMPFHTDGKHPEADTSLFKRREFCFTLKDDIFVRYQSFKVTTISLTTTGVCWQLRAPSAFLPPPFPHLTGRR